MAWARQAPFFAPCAWCATTCTKFASSNSQCNFIVSWHMKTQSGEGVGGVLIGNHMHIWVHHPQNRGEGGLNYPQNTWRRLDLVLPSCSGSPWQHTWVAHFGCCSPLLHPRGKWGYCLENTSPTSGRCIFHSISWGRGRDAFCGLAWPRRPVRKWPYFFASWGTLVVVGRTW